MSEQAKEIDLYGNTKLHSAIRSDAEQSLVDVLLKDGMDPNAQNEKGQTPLHLAVESIYQPNPCIQMLLEAKADPNIKDRLGNTSLHCAVRNDNQKVVELLQKYQADLLVKNNLNETPADLALRLASQPTQVYLRSHQEQKEMDLQSKQERNEFEREFEALPISAPSPSRSRRI